MTKRGIHRLAAIGIVLVVVVAGIAGALAVRKNIMRRQTELARVQGLALYHAGEHAAALPLLGRYIGQVKDDPETLLAFGISRMQVPLPNGRHLGQAIAVLKSAIEIEPTNLAAREALLDVYKEAGFLTELADLAEKTLGLDPTNKQALITRVEALHGLERDQEALAAAEALVAAHPDDLDSHALYVEALRSAGHSREERAVYMRSLETRFKDNPDYQYRISRVEWGVGDNNAAQRHARTAASLPPNSADMLDKLVAWLRFLGGNLSTVTASAEAGEGGSDGEPGFGELANTLLERGLSDPLLGQQVAVATTRRTWWADEQDLARQYAARIDSNARESNENAAGWVDLVELSTLSPDDVNEDFQATGSHEWATVLTAMAQATKGSAERALTLLAEFDTHDPELYALAQFTEGLALRRISDLRGAALVFRNAAETPDISRDRAWRALGEVLARLDRFEESETAFGRIRNRDAIPTVDRLDQILSGLESNRDALIAETVLNALGQAAKDEPQSGSTRVRFARSLILAGRVDRGIDEARAFLDSGLDADPIGILGLCRTMQSIDPAIVKELLARIDHSTSNSDILLAQSLQLARMGDLTQARTTLDREIEAKEPADALPYHVALIRLLDQYDPDGTLVKLREFSDEYEKSATAQLTVLSTISAWKDLTVARAALARLRQAVGENNLSLRIFEARATLAEDPSDDELSKVILGLSTVLKQSPDEYDALILASRSYKMIAKRRRESDPGADVSEYIDKAAQFYDRAVGESTRAFAFRPYIEMLLDYGRTREAGDVLDRFVGIDDIPMPCRADRIELLMRLRRWEDAIADQAWFASSGSPAAVLNLAELRAKNGDHAGARAIIDRFLAGTQRGPESLLRAAGIMMTTRQYDDAIEILNRLPEDSELGTRDSVIGVFLSDEKRPDLALPYLVSAARSSHTIESWVSAIQAAIGAHQPGQKSALLAEARRAFPNAPELAVFSLDDSTRAMSRFVANAIGPDAPPAELELARIADDHAEGRLSNADLVQRLESFSRDNPENYAAWRLRWSVLVQTGALDEAIRVALDSKQALPDDPRPLRDLVNLVRQTGDFDSAIRYAVQLADLLKPDTYEPDLMIGQMEMTRGNYSQAVNHLANHLSQMLAESTDRPTDGLSTFILSLVGSGDNDQAYTLLSERSASTDPAWLPLYIQAIRTMPPDLLQTKRDWLEQIGADMLKLARAESWLDIAHASGKPDDARRVYDLASSQDVPDSPTKTYLLAESASLLGDVEEAERSYRALIDTRPDAVAGFVGLADLLSKQPDRAADAIAFIDDAISTFSTGPTPDAAGVIWLRLYKARILAAVGRSADAETILDKILAAFPDQRVARITLARIYADRKEFGRAEATLQPLGGGTGLDHQFQAEFSALQDLLRRSKP